MEHNQKSLIYLRAWAAGKGYDVVSRALDFAQQYHVGLRKDGVTPEFAHLVAVTQYLRTLSANLIDPPRTLAGALLHDVKEDYDIDHIILVDKFGIEIANDTELMSKVYRGVKKSNEQYFSGLASEPSTSVTKGSDRINNFQSMVGVFTTEKQIEYIAEAEIYILPMIKIARHRFPEQECAYENIKLMLNSQISLVRAIHGAGETQ